MTDEEQRQEQPAEQEGTLDKVVETAEAAKGEAVEVGGSQATAETPDQPLQEEGAQLQETPVEVTVEAEPVAAQAGQETAGQEGASYEPGAEGEGGRPRRIKDLEPGMELEGRVTSVALYGIFVDIGVGRDGLVHISEMSDHRIETPTDLVQIGDIVKVRVKSVDPETRRISLTMRPPRTEQKEGGRRRRRQEVDSERLASLKPGDLVEGTISGLAPFGAFVDIGVGKDGLVHVSELSTTRVEKPEDAVSVGEKYTFRILEVDPEGTRISLSLRRASEDYQERPRGRRREREINLEGIEPGTVLEGTISGLAPFGAFVDVGAGRDGLVHISELGEGRIAKVEDAVKVGDKVTVRVLGVDPESKRISLSLRLEPREETPRPPRAERPTEERERRDGGERRARRGRSEERERREPEVYVIGDEEEETFEGNATLDDLISKYGGPSARKAKGRKQRDQYEDEDEEYEADYMRRQRDVIRRTLNQMRSDED